MFSPYSIQSPHPSVKSQKLNKSSPCFSPLIRRSLTSSFSRNSSLNRTFMTSVLEEATDHIIQCYGSPLPVLVTEAITVADKITDISVKLEPFGYASLVCGRQLLIWKYKEDGQKSVIHCKELTLPPSDLAHRADLVHLFQTEDSRLPSALAVSPEGHVRYWPNINHEGSSVDAQPDLQGQECCSLTSIYPMGCILATTSSSLILITPTIGEGQPNVICRPLTLPLGMLAGIGRRVSSFIFGVIPAQTAEMKQLHRVLSSRTAEEDYLLHVLSMSTLQKWHIAKKDKRENSDQLLFEVDLERELKQCYIEKLLHNDTSLISHLKTWCLDIQLTESGVMVLTAGTVFARSGGTIHYALGIIDTSTEQLAQNFYSFHLTNYCESYQEETEEEVLSCKLLLPTSDSSAAYIYNPSKVLCVQFGPSETECSEINFADSGNLILGSGSCEGMALLFSKDYGIVSCLPNKKALGDTRLLASLKDVSIRHTDTKELPDSLTAKLRTAMCSYCSGDLEKCEHLIEEILSSSKSHESEDINEAVVALSLGIIDDYPVSDPRWCESIPTGSVSSSLIISYQLEDKLKAHEYLLSFLKAFHFFEKLSISKIGDSRIPTNVLLCEHAEKVIAAKALRLFLTDHNEIIESAVRDTLERRSIEISNHLTPQDVFFREVSAFHTLFPSLLDWEMEQLNADESLSKALSAIMTVNKIFVGLVETISEYRQSKRESYCLQDKSTRAEFLPWTSRIGPTGIRHHLRNQLDVNITYALNITDNIQIQGVLYQQYVSILDFYLDSYRSQLQSLTRDHKTTLRKEYTQERSCFIQPLLSVGQYERAAAIAEKYLDFDLLVQICEETKNVDRLQRYMLQFTEQNFSEFVFKWYLDKGQKGKIFDKHLGQREVLGQFLQQHESLKWLYFIQEEKYDAAQLTLKHLALEETEFLNRKKTLLSLSKLCAMISDVPQATKNCQIEAIDREQYLITQQELLPLSVVEAWGVDAKNMRVFSPEELIEMYICEENVTANAYDFKIALDLLSFMKKPSDDIEVHNLRMRIWSKAVLRDNWEELDINNPLDAVKEATFFQIIELAFDEGIDIHDFMPPMDELLLSAELQELATNPRFKFLLQAGYEHILKIIA